MNARSFHQTVRGIENAVASRIHTITNTTLMHERAGLGAGGGSGGSVYITCESFSGTGRVWARGGDDGPSNGGGGGGGTKRGASSRRGGGALPGDPVA